VLIHAACDLLSYPSPWTRPPYLRVEDMDEAFASLSPVGISAAASSVSGIIAALFAVAFEAVSGRRTRTLALTLAAFWAFSAVLTYAVWLSTPWPRALVSLALALPRGAAVAWALSRILSPSSSAVAP
jgi:hypothetical protein